MATNEDFALRNVASGYITRFYDFNLDTTETLSGFGTVTTQPQGLAIPSPNVDDGLMKLPGGRIYNPWGMAGMRAPTSFPEWSQPIMFKGDAAACRRRFNVLMSRVGLTGDLTISHGRITSTQATPSTGHFGNVTCNAMMLPGFARAERVLTPGDADTWFVVTVRFQQTGEFHQ